MVLVKGEGRLRFMRGRFSRPFRFFYIKE